MRDGAIQDQVHFFGRLILASYFAARGLGLVVEPGTMEALVRAMPVSPLLAVANSAFLITCAIFIALGVHTRFAALLLALYLFWSSYIFNFIGVQPPNLVAFWKDLALIGGLMMLVGHGRGIWAFDNLSSSAAARTDQALEESDPAPMPAAASAPASLDAEPETAAPDAPDAETEAGAFSQQAPAGRGEPVFHHRAAASLHEPEKGGPAGSFYASGRGEFRPVPPLTAGEATSHKL